MISSDTYVLRSPGLLTADIGGETVILDVQSGHYFSLDLIGTDILNRLTEPMQVCALCALLEQEYDGCGDTIRQDLCAFLGELLERKIIQPCPDGIATLQST